MHWFCQHCCVQTFHPPLCFLFCFVAEKHRIGDKAVLEIEPGKRTDDFVALATWCKEGPQGLTGLCQAGIHWLPWQVGVVTSDLGLGEQERKLSEVKLELSCWNSFGVSLLWEAWSLCKHERGKKGEQASLLMHMVGFYYFFFFKSQTDKNQTVWICGPVCVPKGCGQAVKAPLKSIFTENLVSKALRCVSRHKVFCWMLFGSSKALRAPELKEIESELVIWILLTGSFICIWGKSSNFPSTSQPSSAAIPPLWCLPVDFLPKLFK